MTLRAVQKSNAVVETSAFVRVASATARHAPAILRTALSRMAAKSG